MRRRELLLGAILLGVAAARCGSDAGEERASASGAKPRGTQPAAPPAERPGAGTAREIPTVLTVEHEVDVTAQREGMVVEIALDEGVTAEKGAILARLDDRSLQAQLEKARADVHIAESNMKYNEAELKANELRYQRFKQMFEEGLGSKAELDEAEFRKKGSEFDLASWRASLEKSHAALRELEVEQDKTRIRAPFRGVVTRRYVREGQTMANGEKCYRLSQLAPLLAEFLVPEADPRRPIVGQTVRGTLAGDPKRTFEARIVRVGPVVDAASGSYDVIAELIAPSPDLKPGMAVHVVWTPLSSKP
jgi:RND family efflux transporter MFP subunit